MSEFERARLEDKLVSLFAKLEDRIIRYAERDGMDDEWIGVMQDYRVLKRLLKQLGINI